MDYFKSLHIADVSCPFMQADIKEKFREWVIKNNEKFPVPEERFHQMMEQYSIEKGLISRKLVGFIDGKLIFFRIRFNLVGIIDPSPKKT